MESNKGTMKHWQPMYTDLKQKPRGTVSTDKLQPSASLLKAFGMHTTLQQDLQKGSSVFIGSHQATQKVQCSITGYSHPDSFYTQHDVQ